MKERIKTVIVFSILAVLISAAFVLAKRDSLGEVQPDAETKVRLYGEAHGSKTYYDIEFSIWKSCYDEGYRNLFVELPYYSAEFLNIWMHEDSDQIIDQFFQDIQGTQSGNEFYYEFFHEIKENCPETVFHGTDVGHQNDTTGARYLTYLEDHGMQDSYEYQKALICMRQGDEFYAADTEHTGLSPVRENYMTENFIEAYDLVGGNVMGIYGSYHTDLSNSDLMAGKLKDHYGDIFSSVKTSTIAFGEVSPYQLGFSVTGVLFLIMLFVPNIIWALGRQPKNYALYEGKENKVLLLFERIGEICITCLLPIFASTNPRVKKLPEGIFFEWKSILLVTALILMILYECYWIRYFRSKKTMKDFYSSFAGFPVAGATLPVTAVLLLGLYSQNVLLIIISIILGIGHIGIHIGHRKDAGC